MTKESIKDGTRIRIIRIIPTAQTRENQKGNIKNKPSGVEEINAGKQNINYHNMETPADSIESLFERAEAYGRTTYELSKLKLLETTNIVVTSLIARLSVILMVSMFSFVLSIAVALWLGDVLGKSYYGFFIVAGFYFLAGVVLHFFLHRWVKKPISELIIKQALQ